MLEKKDVVQKSFRIHRQNDIWLGLLAAKLGRTQNELVNIAIKMLLEDNKKWFFEEFVKATFGVNVLEDAKSAKRRLGDTEVTIIPYDSNPEGRHVSLNVTRYKDEISNMEECTYRIKVEFEPGYMHRVIDELTNIFEDTLVRYPDIMKDFKPGATIDEF